MPPQHILKLSRELYSSKLYEECEPLLEKITNYNLNHPAIFNLLKCYFENGKNKEAIKLAESLIKEFPNRVEPVLILSTLYEELGNREKAIKCYERFTHNNLNNCEVKLNLIFLYIRNEDLSKAKKLLNNFDSTNLSVDQINRLSIAYNQTEDIKRALEIQYQAIKQNPNRLDLQSVYIGLFRKETNNEIEIFLQPNKISLDCYVKVKDIKTQEEKEVIIEDQADIFTPDHEFSRKLMGKKIGHRVQINNESYEILELKSKYVHKFQNIMKDFNMNFPSSHSIKKFSIPKQETSEKLLQSLKEVMCDNTPSNKNIEEKVFRPYKEGKITIGFIANILEKHPFEVINFLVRSNDHKFISLISEDQNQSLKDETNLIIDFSSLATIHWIGMEKEVEKSNFNLYVCQSTVDSLKEFIKEMKNYPKEGLRLFNPDEKNNPFTFIAPESIKQNLDFLKKIEKWINDYCQTKSLSDSYIMRQEDKLKIQEALGKEFFDSLLAVHNQNNTFLLSEDGVLSLLPKTDVLKLQFSRIRLLNIINHLKQKNIIDENRAIQLKAELVKLNQTYIPVNHKVLIFLLKEAQYSINDIEFQRALFFLGPVSELSSIIEIISEFLITLYQEPISFFLKKIIMEEVLKRLFYSRNENSNYMARKLVVSIQSKTILRPIIRNEIYRDIKNFVKSSLFII